MTEIYLTKTGTVLVPNDDSDRAVVDGWKQGELVLVKVVRPRNPQFHRKYFALLNYGFECWEPTAHEFAGNPEHWQAVKHFDRFRKDIAIACGHYELVVNIKGDVRAEAKSISFASMDEDEFSALYERTITYLIRQQILRNQTPAEVDAVVEERVSRLLEFA